MTSGIRFVPEELDKTNSFVTIYEKCHALITHVAKHYKVCRSTIYKYLEENPAVKLECEKIISINEDEDLLQSDFVFRRCLQKIDSDPRSALTAAKYVSDQHGHKRNRGNCNPPQKQDKVVSKLDELNDWTDEVYIKITD